MRMTIARVAETDHGTFGVLMNEGQPFALTLERKWLGNQRNVSCIPTGNYQCGRVNSPKFGNTFEVRDVPDRSHILFHKGNIDDDSHGCILVGEQFGILGADAAVLSSRAGFNEFLGLLNNEDEFTLIVREA